jgi:hypothetical protein
MLAPKSEEKIMSAECEHEMTYMKDGPRGEKYRFCEKCGRAEAIIVQYVDHITIGIEVTKPEDGAREAEEIKKGL